MLFGPSDKHAPSLTCVIFKSKVLCCLCCKLFLYFFPCLEALPHTQHWHCFTLSLKVKVYLLLLCVCVCVSAPLTLPVGMLRVLLYVCFCCWLLLFMSCTAQTLRCSQRLCAKPGSQEVSKTQSLSSPCPLTHVAVFPLSLECIIASAGLSDYHHVSYNLCHWLRFASNTSCKALLINSL